MVHPLPPTKSLSRRYGFFRALGIVAALSGSGYLSYRFFVSTPTYHGPESDMRGKTVLITEADARFSRDLLRGLTERGAQLILCSHNLASCADTRDKLLRATRASASRVDCRILDMGSCLSIRRFAAGVLSDYHKIDRVIIQSPSCVTTIMAGKRRPTIDGFEHQLGTNYFASYLLTRLLWQRLCESDGRLILVADTDAASEAVAEAPCLPHSHQIALPIDDLNFDASENYVPKKAYQRSQWFLTLFADELARRTGNVDGASVFLVNPRISRGTAPDPFNLSHSREGLYGLFDRFTDYGAHIIRRRAATTALFCTIADPAVIEQTGGKRTEKDQNKSLPLPVVVRAPLYQDLRLMASAKESSEIVENCRTASQLLWLLSEKWTRLDTNPDPFTIPKRSTQSTFHSTESVTQDNSQAIGVA